MKIFYSIFALLILSINVLGQNQYYYYKGEKILLTPIKTKKFILFDKNNVENINSEIKNHSYNVNRSSKDVLLSSLIPFSDNKNRAKQNWMIIENNLSTDLMPSSFRNQLIYSAPFFKTTEGDTVGLSHLFYVRLNIEEDIIILKELAAKNDVDIIGNNEYMKSWYTLACSKNSKGNALEMANLFHESGKFLASEPDIMIDNLLQCVNDENFDDQWNLKNTGQYGGTSGVDINVCDAWQITEGNNDIVLAVVDHGFELNHPDLSNISNYSYDTETNTSPSDVYGGHGTACAGIAGAASDNNDGIAGVAPNCQLMSISNELVININVRPQLANGINRAWQNGADVISNSWGGPLNSTFIDEAIDSALTFGRNELGCVVVFASGNDNSTVNYPANSIPILLQ